MSNKNIKVGQLAKTIDDYLTEYGEDASEAVLKAGKKTARETAQAVNASASALIHGRRGTYEKSWRSKVVTTRLTVAGVVYSTQPGLPHLLEHGHNITYLGGIKSKGPGWSPAKPHIERVDKQVPHWFEVNIQRELEKNK